MFGAGLTFSNCFQDLTARNENTMVFHTLAMWLVVFCGVFFRHQVFRLLKISSVSGSTGTFITILI